MKHPEKYERLDAYRILASGEEERICILMDQRPCSPGAPESEVADFLQEVNKPNQPGYIVVLAIPESEWGRKTRKRIRRVPRLTDLMRATRGAYRGSADSRTAEAAPAGMSA